ncbi:hypothetical protein VUR80DRAFT_817 [Thermomyces stellatus]
MSNNNENNENMNRSRRGSVGNAVLSSLFQRNNSTSAGSSSVIPPVAINMNDAAQRRRLSVSTLGLNGSPTSSSAPYHFRRASTSTNSESIDESAVEEDDTGSPNSAKNTPPAPFRRMSMGGPPRTFRNGSIATDQGQFAWSEQLRNRAESSVSGQRPSFSFASGFGNSPPRANSMQVQDQPKAAAEMPAPPAQSPPARSPPAPRPKQPERRKPDAFQERILKGDFYMD